MNLNEKNFLRDVIGNYMLELGKADDKVVLVNADLMGTCRNRSFVEAFPERSFNVGIAEANMVSFAAGLAHEGFKPYCFTMAPFMSMRACEQVRTDVAYADANVKLIGVYAGLSGGISGATHWSIEDIGIMNSIPNMRIMEASDPLKAQVILDNSLQQEGPMYFRSTIEPVPSIDKEDTSADSGLSRIVRDGNDGTFICSGITVKFALEAANRIFKEVGKNIRVLDMYSIKPIDRSAIIEAAKTDNVVVAQDHNVIGGLGSIVSEIFTEEKLLINFKNLGVKDEFVAMAHPSYLYHQFGYDKEGMYLNMMNFIKTSGGGTH